MSKFGYKQQNNVRRIWLAVAVAIVTVLAVGGVSAIAAHVPHAVVMAKQDSSSKSLPKVTVTHPADYNKPSENKPYPDVNKYPKMWIHVSTEKQRVYFMNGHDVLYTMYCSTGIKSHPTPKGTYHVQAERGQTFYSDSEKEGANYYTSWSGHGSLLFHTVPIDANGNYIKSEAAKLGTRGGASHGCVRLAIPDAKWIYNNVKFKTKVVID